MANLSLSDAARVTGIPRTTLQRHIDAGRLHPNPDGTIDTEELHRVRRTLHPRLRTQELRGRPGGSTLVSEAAFRARYAPTYHALQERTGRRPNQLDVAEELGMSETTLRRYLRRYRLPWPPA